MVHAQFHIIEATGNWVPVRGATVNFGGPFLGYTYSEWTPGLPATVTDDSAATVTDDVGVENINGACWVRFEDSADGSAVTYCDNQQLAVAAEGWADTYENADRSSKRCLKCAKEYAEWCFPSGWSLKVHAHFHTIDSNGAWTSYRGATYDRGTETSTEWGP